MNPVFNVVFFGETLPGYDRAVARQQLQALLKCSPAALEQVFSGQRVGLRKGLDADEARLYQLRLKGIGLIVVIEPAVQPAVAPPPRPDSRRTRASQRSRRDRKLPEVRRTATPPHLVPGVLHRHAALPGGA